MRYLKVHLSRGLFYGLHGHVCVEVFTNVDWAGSSLDKRSTTGDCTFIGGNLVTWKNKKHTIVLRSSVESEYHVMTYTSCGLMWLKHFLDELMFEVQLSMSMYYDNQLPFTLTLIQCFM